MKQIRVVIVLLGLLLITMLPILTACRGVSGNLGEHDGETWQSADIYDTYPSLLGMDGIDPTLEYCSAAVASSVPVAGDINGDGRVSIVDIVLLNAHVKGKIALGADIEAACDCTGNGVIDSSDVTYLQGVVLGHTLVVTPGILPTCTENGLSEGIACSSCQKALAVQMAMEASGHKYIDGECFCGASLDESATTYIVTFVDYNNTIIDIQEVQAGESAIAPNDPTRANYSFVGWDTSFTNVSEDITVRATYIRQYTVTFVDYDGTVLNTQVVNSGSYAVPPMDPERTGYDFEGWDKAHISITANTTITALYKIKTFNVTFKMPDGTIIPYVDYQGIEHSSQTVEYGSCAEVPNYSDIFTEIYFDWNTMSMRKFSGWDEVLTNITNDIVVTAEYNDYYKQPVVAIEQIAKTISVKIYMPEAAHLYALDISFNWTGSVGVSNYLIDEISNVLYLTDNTSKSISYNNKQKTFHYSWTCGKGVKVPDNEYFDIVEITFSTSGGSQLNIESMQRAFTLVYGETSDMPIEQLTILDPIVVIK